MIFGRAWLSHLRRRTAVRSGYHAKRVRSRHVGRHERAPGLRQRVLRFLILMLLSSSAMWCSPALA
jgi:hypothetical protein